MISTNERTTDLDDVGMIFHSILRYADGNAERLDRSVVSIGYGVLLQNADLAARLIAELHDDEGDDYDGCVWLERLEDISPGSLAEALYTDYPDVESEVTRWLSSFNRIAPSTGLR